MSVMDELRERLKQNSLIASGGFEAMDILYRFERFVAEHPGLADFTVPCPVCGKPARLAHEAMPEGLLPTACVECGGEKA